MNYKNLIEINGTHLNVYTEGEGDITIVFMSGNGVTLPVLEYRPIYRRMSDKYRIAVIEKAGYGFSSSKTTERSVENLVAEDREALAKAGIRPPYVLAAHSYSGLEAVYWANTYPDEVKAVLSMDMAVPDTAIAQSRELPEEKRRAMIQKQQKLIHKISKGGILTKLMKNKLENATGLMSGNELTEDEKAVYKEHFYKNLAHKEFADEALLLVDNAVKVSKTGLLKCPCCFFISDMKLPVKSVSWRQNGIEYAEKCGGEIHLSDKGHMMYAVIPDEMADTFKKFLIAHNL